MIGLFATGQYIEPHANARYEHFIQPYQVLEHFPQTILSLSCYYTQPKKYEDPLQHLHGV